LGLTLASSNVIKVISSLYAPNFTVYAYILYFLGDLMTCLLWHTWGSVTITT